MRSICRIRHCEVAVVYRCCEFSHRNKRTRIIPRLQAGESCWCRIRAAPPNDAVCVLCKGYHFDSDRCVSKAGDLTGASRTRPFEGSALARVTFCLSERQRKSHLITARMPRSGGSQISSPIAAARGDAEDAIGAVLVKPALLQQASLASQ